MYKVKDDEFKSYADLESYIKIYFTEETAQKLLLNPLDNGSIYVDVNGELGIDDSKISETPYNTDWSEAEFEIEKQLSLIHI